MKSKLFGRGVVDRQVSRVPGKLFGTGKGRRREAGDRSRFTLARNDRPTESQAPARILAWFHAPFIP